MGVIGANANLGLSDLDEIRGGSRKMIPSLTRCKVSGHFLASNKGVRQIWKSLQIIKNF